MEQSITALADGRWCILITENSLYRFVFVALSLSEIYSKLFLFLM